MMTIDEAIKHCEEVADGFDETAQEIAMQDKNGVYQPQVSWHQDRASSQRQLAKWLRELKTYKDFKDKGYVMCRLVVTQDAQRTTRVTLDVNTELFDNIVEVNADEASN